MARPVTLFTGQWADLPLEELCQKARTGATTASSSPAGATTSTSARPRPTRPMSANSKRLLAKYGLQVLGDRNHLAGQCVVRRGRPALDGFAPDAVKGKPRGQAQLGDRGDEGHRPRRPRHRRASRQRLHRLAHLAPAIPSRRRPTAMIEAGFQKIWPTLDPDPRRVRRERRQVRAGGPPDRDRLRHLHRPARCSRRSSHRPSSASTSTPATCVWQGVDPAPFIREFPDRIYHVHMKDAAVTLDGKAAASSART